MINLSCGRSSERTEKPNNATVARTASCLCSTAGLVYVRGTDEAFPVLQHWACAWIRLLLLLPLISSEPEWLLQVPVWGCPCDRGIWSNRQLFSNGDFLEACRRTSDNWRQFWRPCDDGTGNRNVYAPRIFDIMDKLDCIWEIYNVVRNPRWLIKLVPYK